MAPGRRETAGPLARFTAAEGAAAAIEFALVLPILVAILLAGSQVVLYVNAGRKVGQVARSISQMISQATPPANSTTATVNATDLHFSYDSTLVIFPYLMADAKRQGLAWYADISINFAGIAFTPLPGSCNDPTDQSACYVASVVWTSTGTAQPGGTNYRPCITPQLPAANTAAPNRGTLPRSVFGPASLVVVDVVFTFTPTFAAALLPPLRIARTAYVQPRYASLISFDPTGNDGIASKCPGY
jgi:Flp pilus assembly protein TadG